MIIVKNIVLLSIVINTFNVYLSSNFKEKPNFVLDKRTNTSIQINPEKLDDDSYHFAKKSSTVHLSASETKIVGKTILTRFVYLRNALTNLILYDNIDYTPFDQNMLIDPINISLNMLLTALSDNNIDFSSVDCDQMGAFFKKNKKWGVMSIGLIVYGAEYESSMILEYLKLSADRYLSEKGFNLDSYSKRVRSLRILQFDRELKRMDLPKKIDFLIEVGRVGKIKYTTLKLFELSNKHESLLDMIYNRLQEMKINLNSLKNSFDVGVYIAMLNVLLLKHDARVFEFPIKDINKRFYSFEMLFHKLSKKKENLSKVFEDDPFLYNRDSILFSFFGSIRHIREGKR